MRKIYKYLIVMALVSFSFASKAQNDGFTFTLLPHIPFSNYYNPGVRVPYNGIAGGIFSNFNLSVYNSTLKYRDIYSIKPDGTEVIDGVQIVNSLKEYDNYLNMNMSLDLINAGFRFNDKWFINIDWRFRMNTDFQYSKDFLGFFILGNGHYLGKDNPCDFNVGVKANAFTEFAVALQYDVNEHLTVGIRPKFLNGIANLTVTNDETRIYTDPETYAISADMDLDIQAASVLKMDISRIRDIDKVVDSMSAHNIFAINENVGLGVDLGASYIANEHWGVSGGIYDLGYIKWRNSKVKKVEKTDVSINEGLFDDYHELTDMELDFESMLDDVVDAVWGNDSLVDGDDYKTYLKTRLMLQGYYEINPMVRFTAIGQLYTVMGKMRPALTVAYSGTFWDHLDLTLNYTMSKYTGSALGLGVGVHAGAFNFFIVSDNILAMTKVAKPTVEFATAYKASGIRTGIVFTIGKYQRHVPSADDDFIIDTDAIDKEKEEFENNVSKDLED